MNFGTFSYPLPANETVLQYAPNSPEKAALKATLALLKSKEIDVPMYIGNQQVTTAKKVAIKPPHETAFTLGYFNMGEEDHITQAIAAALAPLRARHGQERKQMAAKWKPSRPGQHSSARFLVLKAP